MAIRPIGVAHVNLNVTDLEQAERFYVEVLGFHVAGKYEGAIVWLNLGQFGNMIELVSSTLPGFPQAYLR